MKGDGLRRCAVFLFLVNIAIGHSPAKAQSGPSLVRGKRYSKEELSELKRLREHVRLYRWGASVFKAVAEQIIERTYLNEKAKIRKEFTSDLAESRKSTEVRRLEAIKEFEAWIKRHPQDRKWTPDVLFRLAELYYEKSTIDFQYAQVHHQAVVKEIQRRSKQMGKELPEPPQPMVDYTPSISYYRRIIKEFPNYRNRDVSHYLLGYTLREMAKQFEEAGEGAPEHPATKKAQVYGARARQAFLALVCSDRYKALDPPTEPEMPGQAGSRTEEGSEPPPAGSKGAAGKGTAAKGGAAAAGGELGDSDPYKGCKGIVDLSEYSGDELKKRRALMSQAWFLLGEQHFDADPMVTLDAADLEKLKQDFARHRNQEQYKSDYQSRLYEKKEAKIKIHNYYAISAYTRVVEDFPKSPEYSDALYKRAWTYFKVNLYAKALDEFDKLLISSKDTALQENAVRYVALCAYYQKPFPDKFGYLLNHYKAKGWLNDGPNRKYPHVKEAFHQLAKIYHEEAVPEKDNPGEQNYRAAELLEALKIYRWILDRGGFGPDSDGKPDQDWKYYKGKAQIQKDIIQIVYLLSVNAEVMNKHPRTLYHKERRDGFNRFSAFTGSPHQEFAKEYEKRWGKDPRVQEALAYLRENSLTEIANEYYILGRREWQAKEAQLNGILKSIVGLIEKIVALQGSGKATEAQISDLKTQIEQKRAELKQIASSYKKYFDAAAKAYDIIINHPQFKDTLSSYQAMYFKADCYFFTLDYQRAANEYKKVGESKISNRYKLQALRSRVESLELNVQINVIPPPWPNPARDKSLRKTQIPMMVLDWHQSMIDYLKEDPQKLKEVPYRFAIAYTYYQYGHGAKAEEMLWAFMKDHCDTTQGFFASQALLSLALIKNQGAGGTTASLKILDDQREKIAKSQCGTKVTFPPKTPKKSMDEYATKVKSFYKKMLGLAADIRMNRADALYKSARKAKGPEREKRYLEAARELEEIARRNPDSPRAAISLYYAAEGYEETKRFRKAKSLYEEIVRKPKYREQIKKVKEERCFNVGGATKCREVKTNKLDNVVNFLARAAWRAMEFQQAMGYYRELALGKVEIDEPVIRVNAYFWYARLLRIHGKPREAVSYYMKYYNEITQVISDLKRKIARTSDAKERKEYREDLVDAERFKLEVFYQVGEIYRRSGDLDGMERYYSRYISLVKALLRSKPTSTQGFYKNNKDERHAAYQMMKALNTLVETSRRARRYSKIRGWEKDMVDSFDRFHMPAGSPPASYAAALAFREIQPQFNAFMKQKLKLKKISLRATYSTTPKNVVALMCELMGWGQVRGRPCKGKALPMLLSIVNPYVKEVGDLTDKFLKKVGLKYKSPEWILAVRARMGQMYAKATAELEQLPLPEEIKRFWKVFWPFVQKYKQIPRLRKVFEQYLTQFNLDIDDAQADMDTIYEAYKEKLYVRIRENARVLKNEAIKNFVSGLSEARMMGISNKWTVGMRKGLTALDADQFPFANDAKVAR